MARKSHRMNRRQKRAACAARLQWLAPLTARTIAALVLMIAARLLHVAVGGV